MSFQILAVYLLGYGVATGGGLAILWPTMNRLFKTLEDEREAALRAHRFSACVGVIERCIYVTAIVAKTPELIAVWLVLKTATEWKRDPVRGFENFNIYLIGNGLSLLFGLLGSLLIHVLIPGQGITLPQP